MARRWPRSAAFASSAPGATRAGRRGRLSEARRELDPHDARGDLERERAERCPLRAASVAWAGVPGCALAVVIPRSAQADASRACERRPEPVLVQSPTAHGAVGRHVPPSRTEPTRSAARCHGRGAAALACGGGAAELKKASPNTKAHWQPRSARRIMCSLIMAQGGRRCWPVNRARAGRWDIASPLSTRGVTTSLYQFP